jgi:Ran GTPase-activating protein (RanGAP) involved in mRNA processing and transport
MFNCLIGILLAEDMLDNAGATVLMLWSNLSLLVIFAFVMQLPMVIRRLVKMLGNRVDAGVVKFLFKQIDKKNLALEQPNTGLLALQQWDNMIEDNKWMGLVGLSKTKPSNLMSKFERLRFVKWGALRDLTLIKVRDPIGVTIFHQAMAKAEPEICRWLVHHDRDFVDLEDDGRDTAILLGLKELARALIQFAEAPTEELSWKRARYADIFLSEEVRNSEPKWNKFHYATLEDIAEPGLGEITQQLAVCFNLNPPEGYVRMSKWPSYHKTIMEFLAEMYVASRRELHTKNFELGDIGFDALMTLNEKMSHKYTTFTVPTNFKLFYHIRVKVLDLRSNRLKHDAGMSISHMLEVNGTLEYLDVSDNSIDDDAGFAIMAALRHNHSLHTLKFAHNLLGPGAGKELAHCMKRNNVLADVDVSWNNMGHKRFWKDAETLVTEEGAGAELGAALRHNKSMHTLNLEHNKLGDGTGDAFAQMLRKNVNLLFLNLASNELLVDGSRYIANSMSKNKHITYLNMADNQLGPKAGMAFARALKDNHTLAHLDLNSNRMGYKAGQAFAIAMMHNATLVSINMRNNDYGPNVGKKWAQAFGRNQGLTDIDFSSNDLGKESHLGGAPDEMGVLMKKGLQGNQQITSLNFAGCHFDSKTFMAVCGSFMQMPAMRAVKLDNLTLDEPSTLQLCNAIESFEECKVLSVANCDIGESTKAASLLSNSIGLCQSITQLDLSGNRLGERCCEKLKEAFSNEAMQVRSLNLSGNELGPLGGMEIAHALHHCHHLTWLDMSENKLDEDVGCELAESLREVIHFGVVKRKCVIEHFEGRNNEFGDDACSELVRAFTNEVTHYIGLQNTGVSKGCGRTLAEGLGKATIAWKSIDVSDNDLGREGANSVWWAMRKNRSVLDMDMSRNKIGEEFGTHEDELGEHGVSIDTALERNYTLRYVLGIHMSRAASQPRAPHKPSS